MRLKKLRVLGAILALNGIIAGLVLPVNFVHRVQAKELIQAGIEETSNAPTIEQVKERMGKSPVEFEENRGQFDKQVRYRADAAGTTIFLTADEAVYVLPLRKDGENKKKEQVDNSTSPLLAFALRMKIVGAHANSLHTGEVASERHSNYFRGSDEANWQTNVPNYGRVRYENVYDGISMIWHGHDGGAVQYDFVVQPNADTEQINLQFDGADRLELDAAGNLLIHTEAGVIKQTKPFTYQDADGFRSEVESGFAIEGNSVKFSIGEYDHSKPLTIDPSVTLNNLAFSTLLGGSVNDFGNDIAVDAAGNVYVVGQTGSVNFPTTTGVFDASHNLLNDVFVAKFNAIGTNLIYSTYLGGGSTDDGRSIAIDSAGNVFVTGKTADSNPDFPTTAGAYDTTHNGGNDVYVTKLNAAGSALVYSTFLGGSGSDEANAITIDSTGNAYLTGSTNGTLFPTTGGVYDTTPNGGTDVFVTQLNTTGSALTFSTFIGGTADDVGRGIAFDASGIFITGNTADTLDPPPPAITDYPTTLGSYDTSHNGVDDVFVTKLNGSATSLSYSTFIGGSDLDVGEGIAVDADGFAYITGYTFDGTTDFPVTVGVIDSTHNGGYDVFATKVNASGTSLSYSTFLGSPDHDYGNDVTLDNAGNAYITGQTEDTATDFPTTTGAFDTTHNGQVDAFVSKINGSGENLLYSTFLGGSGGDGGTGLAVDSVGNVFVAGSSFDETPGFPTTGQVFQPTNNGANDAFVAKLGDFAIVGRVIDATTGNPLSAVMVSMSGQISANMLTGADGRFVFIDTVPGQPHTVSALRSGYNINPSLFNIANLNANRELIFMGTVGSPTGGSGGTLRFTNLTYNKGENGSSVTATVERVGQIFTTLPVTVDYTTTNGTAIAGQDFAATSGVLVFNAFETSRTIIVPLLNDSRLEARETFGIAISNPTNDADVEVNRGTATVQILDDDLANGDLVISEFRQRGRLGANDEYVKLFNPNSFDVTIFAPDESSGMTLARSSGAGVVSIAMIPNLITIPARGHFLLTNNNPNGGFSLIDYPTGAGTTAAGDVTFPSDIPDNSNLVLLRTTNTGSFDQSNLLDAVGFTAGWTSEGKALPAINAENSEMCFVRKLKTDGTLEDTGNNRQDFLLVDNHALGFTSSEGKIYSTLGAPAPETTESLRLMSSNEVSFTEFLTSNGTEVFDYTPVPNGTQGTLTLYRQITNNTGQPITRLRLRVIDFPTAGSATQRRYSSRPDFRILNSSDTRIENLLVRGVTLAAERLQPNGGGLNSTLTVDSVTGESPLPPGESVIVTIRLGVVRYGRHPFTVAIEAMR